MTLHGLTPAHDAQSQSVGGSQPEVASRSVSAAPSIDFAFDDFGKTGELTSGSLTDDRTPTLIGKAQPNSPVAIYDGDVQIGNAYASADGSWHFPVPTL
ncbi:Ig-like domain-containing protein, partial [Pseudomonas sp. SDO524_S393]